MRKKVTIKEVAERAGVSASTVSRVISNTGRIGKKTRNNVIKIIEEMNYTPNVYASGLSKSKTKNIGIVMPISDDGKHSLFENIYFQQFLQGANDVAHKYQYDVLISSGKEEEEVIERFISTQKTDGLILLRARKHAEYLKKLQDINYPFVVVGDPKIEGVQIVDGNNYETMHELTQKLVEKFKDNIFYFSYGKDLCVTYERLDAYLNVLEKKGYNVLESNVFIEGNGKKGKEFLNWIMNKKEKDKCLITSDYESFMYVMKYMKAKKLSFIDDINLVAFNDFSLMKYHNPPISAVDTFPKEFGVKACEKLIKILEGENVKTKDVVQFKIVLRN